MMHALHTPRPSLRPTSSHSCSRSPSVSGAQQPCRHTSSRPQHRRRQHTSRASEAAAASPVPDEAAVSTSEAQPADAEQQQPPAAAKPTGKVRARSAVAAAMRCLAGAPDAMNITLIEFTGTALTRWPPHQMSAHAAVSEALANVSITIVGDDTALNWAICQALAKKLGWFPVHTAKVLAGMLKVEQRDLAKSKSSEELADLEADMLRGMRDQYRCCIATLGNGAAARPNYANLWGSVIIWVDEVDKRHPKPASPAREAYAQAEVRAAVEVPGGFGAKQMTVDEKACKAVGQLIAAIGKLLQQHPSLPELKWAYITLGCRGDWPDLQPPEWNPVLEAFGRQGGSLVGSSSSQGTDGSQ